MADIFLSYARDDLEPARLLARALQSTGWSVFWDRTIPAGQTWRQYIGLNLEEARCVIVGWSKVSVESDWVIEEADLGRERGILVPVFFEKTSAPLGFKNIQSEDLTGWDGTDSAPVFKKLVRDLEMVLGRSPAALADQPRKADENAKEQPGSEHTQEERRPEEPKHHHQRPQPDQPSRNATGSPRYFLWAKPRPIVYATAILLSTAAAVAAYWIYESRNLERYLDSATALLDKGEYELAERQLSEAPGHSRVKALRYEIQRAAAEAKRKAEEEARQRAAAKRKEEEAGQAAAEAKREAEEEARQRAVAEAKRKEEEAGQAAAEAKRKAEEAARQRAAAEAKRKEEEAGQAAAEAKRKAEEEARQRAAAEAQAAEEARIAAIQASSSEEADRCSLPSTHPYSISGSDLEDGWALNNPNIELKLASFRWSGQNEVVLRSNISELRGITLRKHSSRDFVVDGCSYNMKVIGINGAYGRQLIRFVFELTQK